MTLSDSLTIDSLTQQNTADNDVLSRGATIAHSLLSEEEDEEENNIV